MADVDLPVLSFDQRQALRDWLLTNYATSAGIFVRIFKKHSGVASVTFEDVLDEGLCFGWSESLRLRADEASYLQKFTPRRTRGTVSVRNQRHVERLIHEGRMTPAGLEALNVRAGSARRSRTAP